MIQKLIAHFQFFEQGGIVTKSKQISEANGRRAYSLNFESSSDLTECWRDNDALPTLSFTFSGIQYIFLPEGKDQQWSCWTILHKLDSRPMGFSENEFEKSVVLGMGMNGAKMIGRILW